MTAVTATATVGRFKCDLCPAAFAISQQLSSHKRHVHPGQAKNPRKRKVQEPEAGVKCPECGEYFEHNRRLGIHRRGTHGVVGMSKGSIASRLETEKKRAAKEAEKNGTAVVAVVTPHVEERTRTYERKEQEIAPSIDTLALALAVGQVKELCRHIAEEHGVPTTQFARQFAELFLRQARR